MMYMVYGMEMNLLDDFRFFGIEYKGMDIYRVVRWIDRKKRKVVYEPDRLGV